MSTPSKPLGQADASGFEFAQEMLAGDPTYGVNFDRIQWDKVQNCYVIVEFLLCEEGQAGRGITPYTSHPNRYFSKNSQKFLALWRLTQVLGGKLYLVNYAKRGTPHSDEVLLMEVTTVDGNDTVTPVKTTDTKHTRGTFSRWFRVLNKRGDP